MTYHKLSDAELAAGLTEIPGWAVGDGALARTFTFNTYKDGVVFAVAVAFEADKLNHHPDIAIGYGKVRVSTVTHDAGGLTDYDLTLARLVQRLAN